MVKWLTEFMKLNLLPSAETAISAIAPVRKTCSHPCCQIRSDQLLLAGSTGRLPGINKPLTVLVPREAGRAPDRRRLRIAAIRRDNPDCTSVTGRSEICDQFSVR